MNTIEIERGLPAPTPRVRSERLTDEMKEGILGMAVGESFRAEPTVARAARQFAKYNGIEVVQKKEGALVRIWRIDGEGHVE